MTTPAPELRKLYLRVIRRIHPDGAIDDQDRLRCERLTQQANHAYAAGDEAALRAVLEPKPSWHGWYLRWSAGRRFVIWWKALKIKPWQVAGAAIAFALVCCYIIIAVRSPKTAHTMRSQAAAQQPQDDTKSPMTNSPAPQILAGEPSRQSASAYRNGNAGRRSPSQDPPGLNRYLETVSAEIENNFNQHSLDAPDGTSADIAVVIRGDGETEEPHLMMPSGYLAVDSACLQKKGCNWMKPIRSIFDRLTRRRKAEPDFRLRISNVTRQSVLAHSVEVADDGPKRRKGLLGRQELRAGEGLWIRPCEAVHTFGMQFPIHLVYLDRKLRVKKVKSGMRPWRLSACFTAYSVIELASGTIRETQTKPGDRIEFSMWQRSRPISREKTEV